MVVEIKRCGAILPVETSANHPHKIISPDIPLLILTGMNLLPFGTLPPAKPRSFVPENIDLGDWPQIAPLFDQLERRASEAGTLAALEKWLVDGGGLSPP